jgi:RHS repeat-associated protein
MILRWLPPINLTRYARRLGLLVAALMAVSHSTRTWADPPSVSRITAPLVTPLTAWSFYTSTAHTTGIAAWSGAPPEIAALARTLGAQSLAAGKITAVQYAQNVYSYVRNNIEMEFRFGLGKGARGALIDQSGTGFDQAELMVKLLRQGGVTAHYQVGTITLTMQQFGHWTGLVRDLVAPTGPVDPYTTPETFNVDALAACQFLADGGVPATVNGASSCSSLTGNLGAGTPVTVAHVWVVANGQTYDPAFKLHALLPRMDLPSLMGCETAGVSTCGSITDSVVANATNGTFGGVPTLNGLNASGIPAALTNAAVTLQHSIEGLDRSLPLINVVGGMTIATGGSGTANASSYTASGSPWTGDVPDVYRTTLTLETQIGSHLLYADEIAGRSLVYVGEQQSAVELIVDGSVAQPTCATTTCEAALGHIVMDVNHPYAANAGPGPGSYGDEEVDFDIPEPFVLQATDSSIGNYTTVDDAPPSGGWFGLTCGPQQNSPGSWCETSTTGSWPITIIHGFGNAAASAQQQMSALQTARPIFPMAGEDIPCMPSTSMPVTFRECHLSTAPVGAEAVREYYTLLDRTTSGATGAAINRHHDLGIVYTSRSGRNVYMSMQSTLSADITRSDDVASRDRAFEISAMLLPHLETSSISDPSEGIPFQGPWLGYVDPFASVASGQMASVVAAMPAIGTYQLLDRNYQTWRRSRLQSNDYGGWSTNLGLDYATEWGGDIAGEMFSKGDKRAYTLWQGVKGAAGGDPLQTVMTTTQISDAAVARRHYASVSLADGEVAFSAPPDIVTGAGDFPKSLSFIRSYRGGAQEFLQHDWTGYMSGQFETGVSSRYWQYNGPDQDMPARLGGGWTHNFNVSATLSADMARALGSENADEASRAIATVVVLNDMAADTSLKGRARAWSLLNQLPYGYTLLIKKGLGSEGFFWMPDGSLSPPAASKARVTTSPAKTDMTAGSWPNTITYVGGDGDVLTFGDFTRKNWIKPNCQGTAGTTNAAPEWIASNWVFADGVRIDFDYTLMDFWTSIPSQTDGCSGSEANVLTGVHNNLGRALHFNVAPYNSGFQTCYVPPGTSICDNVYVPTGYKITGVSDEHNRGMTFGTSCQSLACDTFTAMGATYTRYEYAPDSKSPDPAILVRPEYRMRRWFTGDDTVDPYQTFIYDELFRVDAVTDILGHQTIYQPGSVAGPENWKFAQLVDPLGNASTNLFDWHNNPLETIDPLGRTTTNTYDNFNRLLQTTFPEGDYSTFTYDLRSNQLSRTQYPKPGSPESGQTIATSTIYKEAATVYNCVSPKTCNKPIREIDGRGYRTSLTWDSTSGLPTIIIKGWNSGNHCMIAGGTCPETDFGYTSYAGTTGSFKLLTSKTEKITSSASTVTNYSYDSANFFTLKTATVDAGTGHLNLTSNLTFDAFGNLMEVDGPRTDVSDDSHFNWDYNSRRLLMAIGPVVNLGGSMLRSATQYTYDSDGQLIEADRGTVTDSNGSGFLSYATNLTAYDAAGNKIEQIETAPGLTTPFNLTQLSYDADDHLLCSTVRMVPAAYSVLPSSACTLSTGYFQQYGQDRITEYIYDAAGQKRQEVRGYHSSVAEVYETLDYTLNGKEKAVADPDANLAVGNYNLDATAPHAHQTNYAYDGFDRLNLTTFADGTTEQIPSGGFDADGDVLTKINRSGQTFTFTYDVADRMLTKVVPAFGSAGANTVSWTYDLADEVTNLTDTAGNSLINTFDPAKRLTGTTRTVPGLTGSQTVSYQYDQAGHRTALIWPDNYCAAYNYDAEGDATWAMEGSFANNTCTTTSTLATFAFDRLKNLADLHYMGNEADVGLSWQTNGDLLSLAHNYVSGTDVSYTDTYNPAHQIYTSTISASAYKYGPTCSTTCTDSYATVNLLNQYTSITPNGGTAEAQHYDSNGNLHTDAAFTYLYDPENHLVSATGTGLAAAYAYDPLGRRTQKSGTGVAQTFFLGDAGDDPIGDYDASGNLLRRYIPGLSIDRPLAMIDYTDGGAKTFFHTDKTGSVVAMSGTTGTVSEGPYLYDPFGKPSSAGGEPFKFDGMRYDTEIGCYYDRARVYCPATGRFLQTDPIGYADDIDWYTWAGNDPTDKTDPMGTDAAADGFVYSGAGAEIGGAIGLLCGPFAEVCVPALAGTGALIGAAIANGDATSGIIHQNDDGQAGNGPKAPAAAKEDKRPDNPVKREPARKLRAKWTKATGKPWPKEENGNNQEATHKTPLGDGGDNEPPNIEPKSHDDHVKEHMEKGDFKRWGGRARTCRIVETGRDGAVEECDGE